MAIRNYPRWRQLGFDATGNSAIRPADHENRTLEQAWSVSDHPLRRYGYLYILGHMEPPSFGEGEVVGGQRWHHSKKRW